MIIGSGFIANSFRYLYQNDPTVIIFASGTSNSMNTNPIDFEREHRLIIEQLNNANINSKLIYFSTCSLLNESHSEMTPYIKHKMHMEKVISMFPKYLVVRLPNVAGISSNPNTLLNFLCSKIKNQEIFNLWLDAYRNIIDIDDVVKLSQQAIESSLFENTSINIANPNNYKINEIVEEMEALIGKSAIYKDIKKGSKYEIDIRPIKSLITSLKIDFGPDYLGSTLLKYYKT
jgi:nucleoside-diphosphate-sugar epimerase